MIREMLINAIKEIAESINYNAYSGFGYRINSQIKNLPVIWIEPPVLTGITGRKEGVMNYKVSVKSICPGAGKSQLQKEQAWDEMERDAIRVYKQLDEYGFIANTKNLKCEPAESSLTNNGELSCSVSFEVEVMYCNNHKK